MLTDSEKIATATEELDDIAILAKTIADELRAGIDQPYERVYWLRHRLSKTVALLGAGTPRKIGRFDDEYEKDLSNAKAIRHHRDRSNRQQTAASDSVINGSVR